MTRKIEFGALAVIGCLCLAVGSVGCSTTPSPSDAGPHDAGNNNNMDAGPHDAGLDPHAIGGKCLDSSQYAQSNCDTGLICFPASALNMCTAQCSTDADCGATTNGQPAICWSGLCVPGCDASADNACNRNDFSCQQGLSAEGTICSPDCTTQTADFCNGFFGYPISACSNDGSCVEESECQGNADAGYTCGSGQACDSYKVQGQTFNVCTQDCTAAGSVSCNTNSDCTFGACENNTCDPCPYGYACDSAGSHVCQAVEVDNYAPCESNVQCPTGDTYQQYCEAFTSSQPTFGPPEDQICLTLNCQQNSDCANVPGGDGQICVSDFGGICLIPCAGDAGSCPDGTACIQLNNGSSYCAPAGLQ